MSKADQFQLNNAEVETINYDISTQLIAFSSHPQILDDHVVMVLLECCVKRSQGYADCLQASSLLTGKIKILLQRIILCICLFAVAKKISKLLSCVGCPWKVNYLNKWFSNLGGSVIMVVNTR